MVLWIFSQIEAPVFIRCWLSLDRKLEYDTDQLPVIVDDNTPAGE